MGEPARLPDVFDPEFLDGALPSAGGDALEVMDPRLDEISTLVFRSRYDEVPLKVQDIWLAGSFDARLLGYYLLGIFIARGPAGFPLLFRAARKALTEHWSRFVPADRKAALADGNLAWLFEHLLKRLKRQHEIQDAQWRSWWDAGDVEYALQEAQTLAQPLDEALALVAPRGRALPRFRKLRRWVDEIVERPEQEAPQAASAQPPSEESADEPEAPDEEAESDEEDVEDVPAKPRGRRPAQSLSDESPAMEILLRKLAAFQTLVKRGEFQKAAVAALDIESVMANFDPRVYFPRLFAPYFTALHEHAEELEPCMSDPESFAARTLTQLYRVDLEAFLRGR